MATTRWPGSEKSTRMAGHSRVQSSLRLAVRNLRPAVGQAVFGEVQGPALVGGDRAPGARHDTEPTLLAGAAADRQLLLAIEPLHELVVGHKTLPAQQFVQPPVAEPAALAGKGMQALKDPRMIVGALGLSLRHRARDPDQPASTTARQTMLLLGHRHRLPPCGRRHQFFASSPLSAWLSSIVSARSCFSRRFSPSSALSRLASETAMPPYLARHL